MTDLIKTVLRILAVTGKELVETIRRPGALISTVLGPFLILLVFGLGYVGQPPLRATLVVPADAGLPTDVETYRQLAGGQVEIVALTTELADARADLRDLRVDVIVIAPGDLRATLDDGEQVVLRLEYESVSPYRAFTAQAVAEVVSTAVNRELIRIVAQEALDAAMAAGQPVPSGVAPELLAAPTRAEVTNLAASQPAIASFYGIAVLALVVQHLAITSSALSMSRDRRRGLIQLLRISPIRSDELLLGKYLAFGFVAFLAAAVVLALLVVGLQVPQLGELGRVLGGIALLIAASTGVGLVIALVSDSERQVVQLSLLVLLASVFFGGLTLDLSQFNTVVQRGAEILPVTQATRLLQDEMLRGTTTEGWRYVALGSMVIIMFGVAGWRLRRVLASRA